MKKDIKQKTDLIKNVDNNSKYEVLENNLKFKNIKSCYELIRFFFKRYILSISVIYIYIFPISFIFLLSFMPLFFSGTILYSTSLYFSVFVTYGITFYIIRESTLYKNMAQLGIKKETIYFSMYILIFITSFLVVFFITFLIWFLSVIGFVTDYFYPPVPPSSRYFGQANILDTASSLRDVHWNIFAYYFILIVTTTFIIAFLFQVISKTLKSYILLSIGYVIFCVFLCNEIFITYAPILEGSYTPYDTGDAGGVFEVASDSVYSFDAANNTISIYPERLSQFNESYNYEYIKAPSGLFGTDFSFFWWVALLFPSNYINMLGYSMFTSNTIKVLGDTTVTVMYQGIPINGFSINFMFFRVNNPEWLLVIVWPYVISAFYLAIGSYFSYR
ncbi:MAG: hypothetical protein HPAVJP_1200 [Candidatus Hepatoplasma vulgare]|nr:MAG: hypothetical protein HPAVJP_1200 [Candidatus Hepatoplasma sp.]